MRSWLVLPLILGFLPWPAPRPALAAAPPARPYAVRDIVLGMTLSALRKMPHPDVGNEQAHIVCSGDDGTGGIEALELTPAFLQAEATKCGYYQNADAGGYQKLTPVPLKFLGEEVTPIFLFHRPDAGTDYRLVQITFAMTNARGGEVIGLFYRAYGGPQSLDVTGVNTTFGAGMPNITYIWRNGVSSIQLDSLSFVLNQMSVVFVDNKLWTGLSARLAVIDRMTRLATQEEQRQRSEAEAAAQREAQKAVEAPPALPDAPPAEPQQPPQ